MKKSISSRTPSIPAFADLEARSIPQLFERVCRSFPDKTALVWKKETTTYAQLDRRSSRWAHALGELGVSKGQIVGIVLDRSIEMIVAVLAVLKAGGAYLPIDPTYPEERKRLILDDAKARWAIVPSSKAPEIDSAVRTIGCDDLDAAPSSDFGFDSNIRQTDLAYVIYTSGSTGKPKGVCIEHRCVLNLKLYFEKQIGFTSSDRTIQFAPFTFDASAGEIFMALLNAATLHLLDPQLVHDVRAFEDYLDEHEITFVALPPAYLNYVDPARVPGLKTVMTAGSAPSWTLYQKWRDRRFVNAYGPTETTVISTAWEAREDQIVDGALPIGKAAFNTRVVVVDENGKPCPVSEVGELWISGAGVARGYLDRPALTAEKFGSLDAFPGETFYRTGDLAFERIDGNFVFVGRKDFQVKIRGHRIELGEIEHHLSFAPLVRECAVVDRRDASDNAFLCAFLVADSTVDQRQLRKFLSDRVPDYMIPTRYVFLDSLPLTPNGKVDRKALAEIEIDSGGETDPDQRLETEFERIVAGVWSDVLGVKSLGRDAHFYFLGGDSISALKVVSALHQIGYLVKASSLAQTPLLSEFAKTLALRPDTHLVEFPEFESGVVELLPIQRWFFQSRFERPEYLDQSMAFDCRERLDPRVFEDALADLVALHPMLRASYSLVETRIEQSVAKSVTLASVEWVELGDESEESFGRETERQFALLRDRIRLDEAPLFRIAVLFGRGERSRVVWVVHHLIVDTVSWFVLASDLQRLYADKRAGRASKNAPRTLSYADWGRYVSALEPSPADLDQIRNTLSLRNRSASWNLDDRWDENRSRSTRSHRVLLSEEKTKVLLGQALANWNLKVEEVLIAAAFRAFARVRGASIVTMNVEHNGRIDDDERLDTSRTVGWFTSISPLAIEMTGELDRDLELVKDRLRSRSQRGLSFSRLRYADDRSEIRELFEGYREPELLFNYSGRRLDEFGDWSVVETEAIENHPDNVNPYLMDIEAFVQDGRLVYELYFPSNLISESDVHEFGNETIDELERMIEFVADASNARKTPSDFDAVTLTPAQCRSLPVGTIDVYPLSPMQAGMLAHHLLEPESPMYFVQIVYRIDRRFDESAFRAAWRELSSRHDVLRTVVLYNGYDEPVQSVLDSIDLPVDVEPLDGLTSEEREAHRAKSVERYRCELYPIERSLLWSATAWPSGDEGFEFHLRIHHLIHDGWSVHVTMHEFQTVYEARLRGETIPSTNERTRFKSYVAFQRALGRSDEWRTFWKSRLAGSEPTEIPRSTIGGDASQRGQSAIVLKTVDERLYRSIQTLCARRGWTVNAFVLSSYAVLLSKWTQKNDIVVGVVTSGRPADWPQAQQIVGCCLNTLPLRWTWDETARWSDVVRETTGGLSQLADSAAFPLASVVEAARPDGLNSAFEPFRTLYNFESYAHVTTSESDGPTIVTGFESTNYRFDFGVVETKTLTVKLTYDTAWLDSETVERAYDYLVRLWEGALRDADIPLCDLSIVSELEARRQIVDFNPPPTPYPRDRTIVELWHEQCERRTDAIALVYRGTSLTYSELDRASDAVAAALIERKVADDELVAVMADRSIETVVAVLGILKAGCAYLPIDPQYPLERKNFMLEDCNVRWALAQTDVDEALSAQPLNISTLMRRSAAPVAPRSTPKSLAYVIYTSGSTGKPKGVKVDHRNVVRLVRNTNYVEFRDDDRLIQTGAVVFDATTFEYWGALLNGLPLVVVDEETLLDVEKLGRAIEDNGVTIMFMTVSLFNQLVGEGTDIFRPLRYLFVGGDALSPKTIRTVRLRCPDVKLFNIYGPTENTTFSTFFRIERDWSGSIPIGRSISHSTAYILGKRRELLPIGAPGELCVAGDGLSSGYWNRSELTAEKFVDHPFERGEKMYRTGDLARWLPDGSIDFLGRIDYQVKIRGFRVEVGEIENRLLSLDGVVECVVVARTEASGNKYLCAFYTGVKFSPKELRAFVQDKLPDYMVPSYFVHLEKMPLNVNGKIDRKQLPEVDALDREYRPFVPATTETQKILCTIWQDVLGVERIGITDNFFESGGHSLKATIVSSRAQKALGKGLNIKEVFQRPTIEQLADFLDRATTDSRRSISRVEKRPYYPASSSQKRIYLLDEIEGQNVHYNMPAALELNGALDYDRLVRSMRTLIERQESLRTRFELVGNEIVQIVEDSIEFDVPVDSVREEELPERIRDFVRPFSLHVAPLLRLELLKLDEERHVLLFDMHHIVSDGTSMSILTREWTRFYRGEVVEPLPVQYKDFAAWHAVETSSERGKAREAFWLNHFADLPPVLEMPTDFPRPAVKNYDGDEHSVVLPQAVVDRLRALNRSHQSTMFMTLLCALTIVLSRYSRQNEIVVGTTVAGRSHADLEGVIGAFVNGLAMKVRIDDKESVDDFIRRTKKLSLDAFEHQDYAFEGLVEKLELPRDLSRNPLFDVMFLVQNTPRTAMEIDGLSIRNLHYKNTKSKLDLTFEIFEDEDEIRVRIEYATALYRASTIERMATHFVEAARHLAEFGSRTVGEIEIVPSNEARVLLEDFNRTRLEYDRDQTIVSLFDKVVRRDPDRVALVFEGSRWTYKRFRDRCLQIARRLRHRGVGRHHIVGLMVDRSVEMLAGLMGILHAGAAYLPLDPKLPDDRIEFMVQDSRCVAVLTQQRYLDRWSGRGVDVVVSIESTEHDPVAEVETVNEPNDLAYTIYTSGSTGQPKGVMIEHRSVNNFVLGLSEKIDFASERNILCLTTFAFDMFGTESLLPLLRGMTLIVANDEQAVETRRLIELIERERVEIFESTPSRLKMLLDGAHEGELESIRQILVGGEALSPKLFQELRSRTSCRVFNMYGPTETTVWSTLQDMTGETAITVGRPIANTQIRIVDSNDRLLPIGVAGELCIAGDGLARGYLNRDELTAQKFVRDPFHPSERMYRTGDLARWLEDGKIEFLGRIDFQVKIRGYRIELGEIETQLSRIGGIEQCVVVDRKDDADNVFLCAFYEAANEVPVEVLRTSLGRSLPEYMVPTYFVRLDRLPLNSNGKVDRKALPQVELDLHSTRRYVAPRDEIETRLCSIWSEVLGVERVGIDDNFFELGGHSLKASVVASRIHKTLNKEVALREIFQKQTIGELATHLRGTTIETFVEIENVGIKDFYATTSSQRRMVLLSQFESAGVSYNIPAAMKLVGPLDRRRLESALQRLIDRHEALRTRFAWVDDRIVQIVEDRLDFPLMFDTCTANELPTRIREFSRVFDVKKAGLVRAHVLSLAEEEHVLLFDLHHSVGDGASIGILVQDLMTFYAGERPVDLPIRYVDYAEWMETSERRTKLEAHRAYWLGQYADVPAPLELPTDFPRPVEQSFSGLWFERTLDERMTAAVHAANQRYETTTFMTLLAAISIVLARYADQDDLVLGTPTAGRNHADLENVVGMFVNTLAIRLKPGKETTVAEYMGAVKTQTLGALEHQDYPFEELVERVVQRRDLSRNPLFDVLFVLQNTERDDLVLEGLTVEPIDWNLTTSMFDLTFSAREVGETIVFALGYSVALYRRSTVEGIFDSIVEVLGALAIESDRPIAALEATNSQSRQTLVHSFNRTSFDYERDATIVSRFDRIAEERPDSVAVSEGERDWTYRDLAQASDEWASILIEGGVVPGDCVALCLERSARMIVAIVAILKTGAAYVPIDPRSPLVRTKSILGSAGVKTIVTQIGMLGDLRSDFFVFDIDDADRIAKPTSSSKRRTIAISPTDTAYVIFTSGSTGEPKGVKTHHRCVLNLNVFFRERFDLGPQDRVPQFAPFTFDASAGEIFMSLLSGARLHVVPQETVNDFTAFENFLNSQCITFMALPPAFLAHLDADKLTSVRKVLSAGSAPSRDLYERWSQKVRFINGYGPTETTIISTAWDGSASLSGALSVPIGKPVFNTRVYVFNEAMSLQPIGVRGEICIAGDGVSFGYVGQDELTRQKFVPHPYVENEVVYRTGDFGRWLEDGNIEFVGRRDDQVKIRGIRIELGDVEAHLARVPGIVESAVVDKTDSSGQKFLCAYFTTNDALDAASVRDALKSVLNDSMIPDRFVRLDRLVYTTNGKIDRKALQARALEDEPLSKPIVGARNALDSVLVDVWKTTLGVEDLGIDQSFFDLGGHSLKAMNLVQRLERLGYSISLSKLFQLPTIRELSDWLERSGRKVLYSDLDEASRAMSEALSVSSVFERRTPRRAEGEVSNVVLRLGADVDSWPKWVFEHCRSELYPDSVVVNSDRFGTSIGRANPQRAVSDLGAQLARFDSQIFASEPVRVRPLTAMQSGHAQLSDTQSGFVHVVDLPFASRALVRTIERLVAGHPLLRSRKLLSPQGLVWSEYSANSIGEVPVVDLRSLDPSSRSKALIRVVDQVLSPAYPREGSVHRFAAVVWNACRIVLVWGVDHTGYDGMSGAALSRQFESIYRAALSDSTTLPSIEPYAHVYERVLERGPTNVDDETIVRTLELEEARDAYRAIRNRLARRKLGRDAFSFRLPIRGKDESGLWAFALDTIRDALARYFEIDRVPVCLMSHGRIVGENRFFDAVGEYLDLVPLGVTLDHDRVQQRIDFVQKSAINFTHLCSSSALSPIFPKTTELFRPQINEDGYFDLILLNFTGRSAIDRTSIVAPAYQHFLQSKRKTRSPATVTIEVHYDDENLTVSLLSVFKWDRRRWKSIAKALRG